MFDDCCLPACGCFGDELDRNTPCEPCGISHAWNCPKIAGHEKRTAQTTEPKLIEMSPLGEVHKGTVKGAE